ncbi:MAG: DUF5723 family protein, partial [Bacteroidales bacterium]
RSSGISTSASLPRDLFTIMEQGGLREGTSYNLDRLAFNATYYNETAFGFSLPVNDRLRIGVRAKFLQGLAGLRMGFRQLTTDAGSNELTLGIDGGIQLSMPFELETDEEGQLSIGGLPGRSLTEMTSFLLKNGMFSFSNPGFGLDAGVIYQPGGNFSFSASLTDLGFIRWSGGTRSYLSSGTFVINEETTNWESILNQELTELQLIDTLLSVGGFRSGTERFTTGLGPKAFLGAQYQVTRFFSIGAVSATHMAKNDFRQQFNLSANLNLSRVLTTSINYNLSLNGGGSAGAALALRFGILQFYTVMDCIPLSWRNFDTESGSGGQNRPLGFRSFPNKLNNFNLMFGMNAVFGSRALRNQG